MMEDLTQRQGGGDRYVEAFRKPFHRKHKSPVGRLYDPPGKPLMLVSEEEGEVFGEGNALLKWFASLP